MIVWREFLFAKEVFCGLVSVWCCLAMIFLESLGSKDDQIPVFSKYMI